MTHCDFCHAPMHWRNCFIHYNGMILHPSCFHKVKESELLASREIQRIQMASRLLSAEVQLTLEGLR